MGAAYIVRKRARFVSINGPVNLPYGTPVDAVDGFLVHKGRPLCAVTSESAHRYFARNDDGNGKATRIMRIIGCGDTPFLRRTWQTWNTSPG